MTMRTLCLGCILLAVTLVGQNAPPPNVVHVQEDSNLKDLARGYAHSFGLLTHPPVSLAIQREGVVRIIDDVRSVRESDGILVVVVGKGLTYLINPRDVIFITDGASLKPLL